MSEAANGAGGTESSGAKPAPPPPSGARVCAILALKPFDDAKERLATGLDPASRRMLARAMATDVLAALPRCERLAEIVVVSAEPSIGELAGETASAILIDDRSSHSSAAVLGLEWALANDCGAALLVPGDCPLIDPEEIDVLVDHCAANALDVAVVPDRMGTGTNALLLTPPNAISPAFGPGSRERHLDAGRSANRSVAVTEVPTLALDIDTFDDLLELAERIGTSDHDAVHTEQAVAALLTDRGRLPGGYAR